MSLADRAQLFFAGRKLPIIAFMVAALLVTPSILVGFSSDDHYVRMVVRDFPGMPEIAAQDEFHSVPWDLFAFASGDADYNEDMMARGVLPWWTFPAMRQRVMHPLTGISHWFDYTVFGNTSWPMHVHSILLLALIAFPATLFYRKLTGVAWIGGLAAWLYMIDDARGMPVGWISNRYIFHAIFLSFIALYAHHRWRSEGWKPGAVIAPACVALGFTCGEAMAAIVAYLVAYEMFLAKGPWLQRGLVLVPYAVVVVVWRLSYTALGFGSYGSGIYVDMGRQPEVFAEKLVSHLPVLLLGMWGKPNSTWWTFLPPTQQVALWAFAVIFLLLIVAMSWRTLRTDAIARFAFVGAVVATLPLCATITDDRLLMFPSIGGALFVARVLSQGNAARPLILIFVIIHLVIAPLLLPLESVRQGVISRLVNRAHEGIPAEDVDESGTIVVLNPPSDWLPTLYPIVRSANEEPMPKHFFALTAGGENVTVMREEDNVFILEQVNGMFPYPFGQLHRDTNLAPWNKGDTVEIRGMHVEILEVTEDQRPLRVRYEFDDRGASLKLYSWDGFRYAAETIAVGESRTFPPATVAGPFAAEDNSE